MTAMHKSVFEIAKAGEATATAAKLKFAIPRGPTRTMPDRLQPAAMSNRLLLLAAALVASASAQVHPPHSGSVTPFAGYQRNYTTDLTASTLTTTAITSTATITPT